MKFLQTLILVWFSIFFFSANAKTEKCVTLDVEFDSSPQRHFNKRHLHFTNQIQLNPYHTRSSIVKTISELHGRFPQTMALLVKPTFFADDLISLQFNILHYGFSRAGSILSQPQIIVKKGQLAELNTDKFKLKVKANWG